MAAPLSGAAPIGKSAPLTLWQIMVVALCVLVNICDGLDTTAMAYAAPSILEEWQIHPQTFGLLLSAAAAGLMIGSIVIAPMADRVGRRTIILTATTTSTIAMFGIAVSQDFSHLMVLRFFTGMAIGALVPNLSVLVVEFSNERRGNIFISLVHIGFAIGAITGALVGAAFVDAFGWRAIFWAAGALTGVTALLCAIAMPESVTFLLTQQPKNALARVNALLPRLGGETLAELPPRPERARRSFASALAVVGPGFLRTTLLLWLASFSRFFVSYFLSGWKPQVFVLAGFTKQTAIAVGVATSAAAAMGVLLIGVFASVVGSARATAIAFVGCAVALLGFALIDDPIMMVLLAAACMFTIEAAFTGVVISATRTYPPEHRSAGVGFTLGVGRFGAILGPYIGGMLIGMDLDRAAYYPVYAAVCIMGAVAIIGAMASARAVTQAAPAAADAR